MLTFFLEALSSQKLPGSVDLLSSLSEMLGGLTSATGIAQGDLVYCEQLLMSCMDSLASHIDVWISSYVQRHMLIRSRRSFRPTRLCGDQQPAPVYQGSFVVVVVEEGSPRRSENALVQQRRYD